MYKRQDEQDIQLGLQVARQLGALDIGQAVVVQDGQVLAVEAAEGTDAMIQRLSTIDTYNRSAGLGGVLVKIAKPQQDHRLDLPTIGATTLHHVIEAGLSAVAIQSEATLLLQRDVCIEVANDADVALIGVTA